MSQFTRHLVARYGIQEVSQWCFEVWNEPNLNFWTGKPDKESYFELYHHGRYSVAKVTSGARVTAAELSHSSPEPRQQVHTTSSPNDLISLITASQVASM